MKSRIGSKLLACLLVFALILTGASFGAFATETDLSTVSETELSTDGSKDTLEAGAADSAEPQSAPQSTTDDIVDTSVSSAPCTDTPVSAGDTIEVEEDPCVSEPTADTGMLSDDNSGNTSESTEISSSGEITNPNQPSATDITNDENTDATNESVTGDDMASVSETNDDSAEESSNAETNEENAGIDADYVETEENKEPDETSDFVDETANDNTQQDSLLAADVSVVINEGQPVYMGETVTLRVEVTEANQEYSIRWEAHDPASDIEGKEPVWNTISRGREYTFSATQATVLLEYRVVVYTENSEIVSKLVRVTALERTEEQTTEVESELDSNTDPSEGFTSGDENTVGENSEENLINQEAASTEGDDNIDDDADDASDITEPAEENKTDENDVDDDIIGNTDAENSSDEVDDDADNTAADSFSTGADDDPEDDGAMNIGSDLDADTPGDANSPDEEEADDDEVIDENEEPGTDEDSEENGESITEDEDNEIRESLFYSEPIIIQVYKPGTGGVGNDELLTGYVEKLFGAIGSQRKLRSAYSVGSSLDGNNAIVYNGLKNMAAAVACGDETSTIYQYDFGEFGPWTAADIGLQTMVQYDAAGNPDITQEACDAAFAKAIEQLGIDADEVMNALLADCPYELYWFNKTKTGGYRYGYSSPGLPYYCENGEWYVSCPIGVIFKMSVATAYQADGNQYAVNATKAQEAHAAVANILNILNDVSGMTTRQKLTYFKNQICDLVSYNDEAAGNNGTPYGNPWQLVWVFDGDPDTNVVCEGYSKAFKYLCDQVGISCLLVTGELGEGTGAGAHMWNLVILDGQSYMVDVTNSDTGTIGQDGGLFMAFADPGSDWNAYTVSGVHYQYDDDTMATFSQEVLTVLNMGTSGEVPQPEFNGHSILLTGQIGLQFFLELPDGKTPSDYPGSYVTFTGNKINSETQHALPSSPAVINGQEMGTYLFTVNLSSIQMADKVTPIFHYTENGEDKTVVGDAYSVKDYIDWALSIGASYLNNQQSAIIPKLADYGHYAQIYLSRQNGWTIGTNYAEMTTYSTSSYDYDSVMNAASGYAFDRTQDTTDVANVNYRLTFGSQVTLTVRIEPAAGNDSLDITAGSAAVTQSGIYRMITYPGVYANQLADTHTIQAGDCAISVSPMSYVYEMLRKETVQNDAKDLMCALYGYAQACR